MSELVSIGSIKPHPRNYRRADHNAIKRSLLAYGQIHSITCNRKDNFILDGNGTWLAAKALGWDSISVNWVDVDDDKALKILVAANGVTAQGGYDNDVLLEMLQEMDSADLPPTGYDENDIHQLLKDSEPVDFEEEKEKKKDEEGLVKIVVGTYFTTYPSIMFDAWVQSMKSQFGRKAMAQIKDRLGFVMEPPLEPTMKIPAQSSVVAQSRVPIDSVNPALQNPRHGDVGTIIQSFQTLGVFKPITVNQRTNTILAGNHRWLAAKSLRHTEIDVEYIDVDPSLEKAIILADNRIADLGENDRDALAELLMGMDDLTGLGYDLSTIGESVQIERSMYKLNIGGVWKATLSSHVFQSWRDEIEAFGGDPVLLILERLGLSD